MTNPKQIIDKIPQWQNLEPEIKTLSGGITNSNYKVEVEEESFVLRICGHNSELLGINRQYEHEIHSKVTHLGMTPEILHYDKQKGHMVAKFVHGNALEVSKLKEPETLEKLVDITRLFHALPKVQWQFCPFEVVDNYAQTAQEHNVPFPENFSKLLQHKKEIQDTLQKREKTVGLCHNDLLNGNFIVEGEKIWVLDWEYAGMGDVFFDLANLASHHDFTEEEEEMLLGYYLRQKPQKAQLAHLRLLRIMSDFREAMWAQVQRGISKLDFDFMDYSEKYFGRTTKAIEENKYSEWLQAVEK